MATKTVLLTLTLVAVTLTLREVGGCMMHRGFRCGARNMFSRCKPPHYTCSVRPTDGQCACIKKNTGYLTPGRAAKPAPAPAPPAEFNFEKQMELMLRMKRLMNAH